MGKEAVYYDEAERLYTEGYTLERIAALLPVSVTSLSRWKGKGDWDRKRQAALASPRLVADVLREVLKDKVNRILVERNLSAGDADELAKITAAIKRLEQNSYDFLAAAVEVMKRFGEWLRNQGLPPEELKATGERIQAWFRALE